MWTIRPAGDQWEVVGEGGERVALASERWARVIADDHAIVAGLARELLTEAVAVNDDVTADVMRRVGEGMPFTPDPFGDWLRAHRKELGRYAGKHVAIRLGEDHVIDSDDDPVALAERNRPWDTLMVTFAAPDLFPPGG